MRGNQNAEYDDVKCIIKCIEGKNMIKMHHIKVAGLICKVQVFYWKVGTYRQIDLQKRYKVGLNRYKTRIII